MPKKYRITKIERSDGTSSFYIDRKFLFFFWVMATWTTHCTSPRGFIHVYNVQTKYDSMEECLEVINRLECKDEFPKITRTYV